MYIDAFRKRVESMVERNSSRNSPDPNAAIHDMAFYPLCKIRILFYHLFPFLIFHIKFVFHQFTGSKNNQTSWLEENTAKLYFSSSIFDKLIPNTFLHRAILRFVLFEMKKRKLHRFDK